MRTAVKELRVGDWFLDSAGNWSEVTELLVTANLGCDAFYVNVAYRDSTGIDRAVAYNYETTITLRGIPLRLQGETADYCTGERVVIASRCHGSLGTLKTANVVICRLTVQHIDWLLQCIEAVTMMKAQYSSMRTARFDSIHFISSKMDAVQLVGVDTDEAWHDVTGGIFTVASSSDWHRDTLTDYMTVTHNGVFLTLRNADDAQSCVTEMLTTQALVAFRENLLTKYPNTKRLVEEAEPVSSHRVIVIDGR